MNGREAREMAAGWSAAAKAAQVREEARGGLLRRFLRALGVDPGAARTEAVAGRWEAGARGEQMTAALLQVLAGEGWGAWHDRALPTGRANFDHILLPPCATFLVLLDSKLWSRKRGEVWGKAGVLRHGDQDRSGTLRALEYETRVLCQELERVGVRVPVVPVMAVHSARVAGGKTRAGEVTVLQADLLVDFLRGLVRRPDRARFDLLAVAAAEVLPRYEDRAGR